MDIDDWARPSRRPIFDTSRKTMYGTCRRAGPQHGKRGRLQNVERHTTQALESIGTDTRYVRFNGHRLDQAISRPVCSAHHSPPWAVRRVSKLCPEEIKDVAWWRHGGMPSSQRHMGVRPWPGLDAQRVWLSPGAPLASGSVTIATTLLLSRGLLGMRVGRPSRDCPVRCSRVSAALVRLGRARSERVLHAHQAAEGETLVQSRGDACRARSS